MSRLISRDPFARQELHRKIVSAEGGNCSWCGKVTNCSSTTLKMIQEDAIFMADHFARKDVMTATIKLEAVYLRNGKWAVRPAGKLGTCGFHPKPWTAIYVKARSAEEAIKKAEKLK